MDISREWHEKENVKNAINKQNNGTEQANTAIAVVAEVGGKYRRGQT